MLVAGLGLMACHSKVAEKSATTPDPPVQSAAAPVVAPKPPLAATNEYHGLSVVDPFRWLEHAADSDVQSWTAQQNAKARTYLDGLPVRQRIKDRLEQLTVQTAPDYSSLTWRGDRLFALKFQPPAQQPMLVTMPSLTNLTSEKVVLDPNRLTTNGATTIDWFVPSPDGQWVAVSLSDSGSEAGTLHLYSTSLGQPLTDVIPRVHGPTAGGSVAWTSQGLLYTRYPSKEERPPAELGFYQQIFFHKLGEPASQDRYEFGKDFPRIAEIQLKSSPDGARVLASVANGDGGQLAHYLREPSGQWREIAGFGDEVKLVEFGRDPLYVEWGSDPALYLLSFQGAPKGQILRLPLTATNLSEASVALAESKQVIANFKPAASGLALVYVNGGPGQFAYFDYFDQAVRRVEERVPTAVTELVVLRGDDILFRVETYTTPYEWLNYNPSRTRERIATTPLAGSAPAGFGDVEVVREMVPSRDGTQVPLNIIRKRGTQLDGNNPTILTGYGGFGISQLPQFDITRRLWLDQGGIWAMANLRGGQEFGEPWHDAGALTNKQNVFDDFAACAEFLIRSNYTRTARLALRGGSNGGLLMGATLTQHPSLARAVVSHVGLYDMLRAELDANGTFNTTEFGTVNDPAQFKALYAYSPYHHVQDQTSYPAILMMTGANDGRVNPAHSRKMTARLQAANTATRPILLRTSSSGHGIGTAFSERVEQLADVYAFLCDQLGVDFSLIDRGPWSGAVTPASIIVKAKLLRENMAARLLVSKSQSLSDPVTYPPVVAEAEHGNVVRFVARNLEPATSYYYGLEVEGTLEKGKAGQFQTLPPAGPASFTIAFSGDARTGSTLDTFDRIREHRPLLFMNLGDFHYLDIQTNHLGRFRDGYDAVLASPQQAALYRQVPFVYVWDDHDFAGNNSNRKAPAREAARLAYAENVPHYPLPLAFADRDGGPICQSFSVGRVKFIVTDCRSERDDAKKKDDAAKTMLGAQQKAWFKQELLAANGKYPLICWVESVAWIGKAGTNYYHGIKTNQYGYIHHTQLRTEPNAKTNQFVVPGAEDWWSVYSTERREIADFIKANRIRGVCILHADSHMLAADDGSNSDYATGGGAPIPVMCAAPLDKEPSIKGGPYSQGVYRVKPGEGCFGLFTVSDRGEALDVTYSGRNNRDEEKISLKFSVRASAEALAIK